MTKKKTPTKPKRPAKQKAGGGCPGATCSASLIAHDMGVTYEVGQIINIQGTDYEIESVKPTRITRDEYGRKVDWPAFQIDAVSPPNDTAQATQEGANSTQTD